MMTIDLNDLQLEADDLLGKARRIAQIPGQQFRVTLIDGTTIDLVSKSDYDALAAEVERLTDKLEKIYYIFRDPHDPKGEVDVLAEYQFLARELDESDDEVARLTAELDALRVRQEQLNGLILTVDDGRRYAQLYYYEWQRAKAELDAAPIQFIEGRAYRLIPVDGVTAGIWQPAPPQE